MKTHSLMPAIAAHVAANFADFFMLAMPSLGEAIRLGFALLFLSFSLISFIRMVKRYS